MTHLIRNTLAVTLKELQVRLRDRGSLVVLFILPLLFGLLLSNIYTSMYGSASGDDSESTITLPIYLVNEDQGPYGRQVRTALAQMGMVDIAIENSAEVADQKVRESERVAAVIIPADFSQRIDAYEPTTVEVVVDPIQEQFGNLVAGLVNYAVSGPVLYGEIQYGVRTILAESGVLEGADPVTVRAAEAQSTGAIMTQLQAMQDDPVITIESETKADPDTEQGFNFFILYIPAFTVMFAFFLVGVIGQSIFTEKDTGTFRRLLASPVGKGSIIGGNSIAYMTIVFLQVLVLFGLSAGIFGMPLGDQPILLLLLTLVLGLTVATLGLMIASLAKSGKQADTIGVVLGFVLAGLGGALPIGPPLYETGGVIAIISNLTPHAHAVQGFRLIMTGTGTTAEILLQIGILLGFALIFFAVARWRFKFL